MPSECEDAGHRPEDDDKPVRPYDIEHDDDPGEFYPRWLCDPCAGELEACGARMRPAREMPSKTEPAG